MARSVFRSTRAVGAALVLLAGVTLGARDSPAQDRPRVVFVTFPCAEPNFLCRPFVRALRRTGVSGRIVSPDPREDPVAVLSLLARQGYPLIVVDFNWGRVVGKVAPRFPKARFAVLDIPFREVTGRPRNARSILIRTHEASFLAGWLAARLEQRRAGRDVVGAVGGLSIPQVDDFVIGFRAGARHASRKVTVLVDYSQDFADPSKCAALARKQIARGAGVVFNVAGACGWGALRAAGRAGVWAIGVDRDQSAFGRHVVTSVVKHFDVLFQRLLEEARENRIRTGETTMLTLRDRGAGLAPVRARVPAALRAELRRLERRIVAGEIRVPGASYG